MAKVIEPCEIYKNFSLEDLPGEIWADIEGWEGFYKVSNFGRVKNVERQVPSGDGVRIAEERILKPSPTRGYLTVSLWRDNIGQRLTVHRLVATAFIPNPENKPFINHVNSAISDNCVENLEWVTHRENISHGGKKGTTSKYTGVYWNKKLKQFRAHIMVNREVLYIAMCGNDEQQAAILYNLALDYFNLPNCYRNDIAYDGDDRIIEQKFDKFKKRIDKATKQK